VPRLIGIDEAGYGPLLGPLVVGASAWEVDDAAAAGELWTPLAECVTAAPRRGDWRLTVGDSKQVFSRSGGVGSLERSVLGFLRATGAAAATPAELLAALGATPPAATLPWYAARVGGLPLAPTQAASDALVGKLGRTMQTAGARCTALLAEVVPEDEFNARVGQTGNKATVLLERVLRLVDRAARGAAQACIHVDRLGGRAHYGDELRRAFPDRALHVLAETSTASRYALCRDDATWELTFTVGADARHLPVALASMLAKYVREVLMEAFNAYWRAAAPSLRPTAGYYTDAQRFLGDIAALLPASGLDPARFVRAR